MVKSKPSQMPNELVPMSMRKCAILFILLPLLQAGLLLALETCLYCRGINCQRSSYQAMEQCVDQLDACVSVFLGGMVQAQGCLEKLEDKFRQHCKSNHNSLNAQCEICVTNSCNNVTSSQLSCLQCLDTEDARCSSAPDQLTAQRCPISHSGRNLCFASISNQRVERGCSLTLSEQVSCLADVNCKLCDPLELPHCNDQLLNEATTTTESPSSSTTSSSTSTSSTASSSTSTSSSSSSSTISSTSSSTSPVTTSSTTSSTTEAPDSSTDSPTTTSTTAKPNSATSLSIQNVSVLLAISQLVFCIFIYVQ